MRVRTDKTERLLSNKGGGLQGTANDWGTALGWRSIQYPVTTEMLIGKEPVDLSSTSDAYFVKEFDRKDAYLKQMNQFHNHGIKASTAKFAVKDGKLFEFACGKVVIWVGGSRRATVRSSAATSSGQLGQSRAGSTRG
jgi:hypothetical protein